MKNIIYFIFLFCFSLIGKAQLMDLHINNFIVSDINNLNNSINVNLKVDTTSGASYLSNSYTINGSVITLKVCYYVDASTVALTLNNNFILNNIPNLGNYTLNVIVYETYDPTTCDYTVFQDTATLNFTTNLTSNQLLAKDDLIVFPNPNNGMLFFNENLIDESIVVFDNSGRIVKEINSVSSNKLNISDLENGIYFVKVTHKDSFKINKIILEK